jgi:hypothetical protein
MDAPVTLESALQSRDRLPCKTNTNEMIYDLAKQLKDARFPFIPIDPNREIWTGKAYVYSGFSFEGKEFHAPTLSELIEACRPSFRKVWLIVKYPDQFRACGITQDMKRIQTRWCKEDTEALGKLWLKSLDQ